MVRNLRLRHRDLIIAVRRSDRHILRIPATREHPNSHTRVVTAWHGSYLIPRCLGIRHINKCFHRKDSMLACHHTNNLICSLTCSSLRIPICMDLLTSRNTDHRGLSLSTKFIVSHMAICRLTETLLLCHKNRVPGYRAKSWPVATGHLFHIHFHKRTLNGLLNYVLETFLRAHISRSWVQEATITHPPL